MSLYDDLDADKKSDNVAGWASGIKLIQNHMQLKKATVIQPKRELSRKPTPTPPVLAPVIKLTSKAKAETTETTTNLLGMTTTTGSFTTSSFNLPYSVILPKDPATSKKKKVKTFSTYLAVDPDWQFEDEYDPLYPNDYDKVLRELRDRRDKEAEEEETKRKTSIDGDDDEPYSSSSSSARGARVEIAPPPSLSTPSVPEPLKELTRFASSAAASGGGSAAARIMAKYGYKEGQGLGKKEQGMATALQVEKTSFRTGRIIHEKDTQRENSVPNPMGLASSMAAYNDIVDDEEENADNAPTLSDMLKNASTVILLKNMVGPGEVDDDLEPEVKEECQGKYGLVSNVTVFQMPDPDEEDPIRIFVEFKEVDSAAKALLDLNGRFFGGRQVKASFYEYDKYSNLELTL